MKEGSDAKVPHFPSVRRDTGSCCERSGRTVGNDTAPACRPGVRREVPVQRKPERRQSRGELLSFNVNGTARIVTSLGATLDATYDRADLVPGGSVPVSLRYTPTNDSGNEFSLSVDGSITGDVTVLAVIELLNVDINANLLSGGASFTAPLGSGPASSSRSSPVFPGEFLGFHVFDVQMAGNATLAPVPPGVLPGLGGAVAGVSAIGATLTSPGLGVVEWDSAGAECRGRRHALGLDLTVHREVDARAALARDVREPRGQFEWAGVFDVLPDIPTISVFSGSLGPVYQQFGLDCLIASAIDGGPCGGLIGAQVAANVAAGRLPIPLLSPPGAVVPPIPALGRIDFVIDPDADNDALFDGTEITGSNPTDPDDSDSDDDVLLDGQEDANRNGAWDAGETNPNNPDTDGEGLTDGCEVAGTNPTNPLLADTDGDGLTDAQEDVDRDCTRDATETDPTNPDTDGDGLNDGIEVTTGTDPLNPDSDGDGVPDGQDVEFIENAISSCPRATSRVQATRRRC